MTYNLTAVSGNTTGILSLAQATNNELMFGWLGIILLIVIAAITYIGFQAASGDTSKSLPAALYVSAIMAMILRIAELIPDLALFITIVGAAISVAFSIRK